MLHPVQQNKPSPVVKTATYESLQVLDYTEGLRVGERKGGLMCPFCFGGGSKEKSFSVVCYPDGVFWRCWRNSCDRKGKLSRITGDMSFTEEGPLGQPAPKWENRYEFKALTSEWKARLKIKYGIAPEYAIAKGWQSNSVDELCIPLRSIEHQGTIGFEFKKLEGFPKTITNLNLRDTFTRNCFDTRNEENKDICVIVEDSISALKVSQVCRAYSIQGTHFAQLHADELYEGWGKRVKYFLLALDRDATDKGVRLIQRYKFMVPGLELCPIVKDLKYYTVPEITELVTSYR